MIRRANFSDIPKINDLLRQVLEVHANGRPDIFKHGTAKYSDEKLKTMLHSQSAPIYVAVNDNDEVLGYAFCQYRDIKDSAFIHDVKYCYIDDICVDNTQRGKGIGTELYEHVKLQAIKDGYNEIRLNVWTLNESAMHFYQKLGFSPLSMILQQKI